jgi:phosphoglycolate phosphatase
MKGVLIDLDGTLLHTVPDLAAACRGVLTDLNLPVCRDDQIANFVGKGAEVLLHRCLTNDLHGVADAALHSRAMTLFDWHYEQCNGRYAELFPQVLTGLDLMKSAGLRLACVTNKPHKFAVPLLRAQGLLNYFEFVQGGDVTSKKKPDPLPLVWAASRLGIAIKDCAAIGDSMNDALAARAAGMAVLMVPYGYNEGMPVQALDCDVIVDDMSVAARLLCQDQRLFKR